MCLNYKKTKKKMENNIFFDKKGNPISLATVNRVEVIDSNGRSYVNRYPSNKVELSFQDDNRTLKIFITHN